MSSPTDRSAVDAEAELLVAFVNTCDLEEGSDELGDPRALAGWIAARLDEQPATPDAEGHARALALRESLRALLRANNGVEAEERKLAALCEAAERSRYRTVLGEDGELTLIPARADLSGFEARLLLALERLQSHGAWPRLKACTEESCQWAFYDTSRNRSRTWCSMDVCGNREKTRRYRTRRGGG